MQKMPSRNVIRQNAPQAYYHVYARGASKQAIFLEPVDFEYFLGLIKRYLSTKQIFNKTGGIYPNYRTDIELLAYCLMNNHFHLFIFQKNQGKLSEFMKSLMSSYSRYFNLKYKRSGSLFENRFKAALISNDSYLMHISRYIHLNPRSWKRYPYSSIKYYRTGNEPEWLHTAKILDIFSNREAYVEFLEDYEEHKEMLAILKHELADR